MRIFYPMNWLCAQAFLGMFVLILVGGCDLRTLNQSSNTSSGGGEEVAGETDNGVTANSPSPDLEDLEEAFAVATHGSTGEAIYSYTNDGYLDLEVGKVEKAKDGGLWAFHQPLEEIESGNGKQLEFMRQFVSDGESVHLWAKTPTTGAKVRVVGYYTTDDSDPVGRGGVGAGTTKVVEFFWGHNSPGDGTRTYDWWWSAPIRLPDDTKSLRYKIGVFRVPH